MAGGPAEGNDIMTVVILAACLLCMVAGLAVGVMIIRDFGRLRNR